MKAIFAGFIAALLVSFSPVSLAANAPDKPVASSSEGSAPPAKPDVAAAPHRRVSRNADARKCLELGDNRQVARCAQPFL